MYWFYMCLEPYIPTTMETFIPFLKNFNSYHFTYIVGTDGKHSKMIAGISVTIRPAMKTY